jgi:hypothetical protein
VRQFRHRQIAFHGACTQASVIDVDAPDPTSLCKFDTVAAGATLPGFDQCQHQVDQPALCCDEKSQIQALDRTQPGLPMKRGLGASMTHDYKRHGTTTLFAALNAHDGTVIADCKTRHRPFQLRWKSVG